MLLILVILLVFLLSFFICRSGYLDSYQYIVLLDKIHNKTASKFDNYIRIKKSKFDRALRDNAKKDMDKFIQQMGGDSFIKKCEEENEQLCLNSLVDINHYTRQMKWLDMVTSDKRCWKFISSSKEK